MTAPVAEPLAHVDGQAISIRDAADCLRRVEACLERGEGFTLFTLNMDHLVKRRASETFRRLYARGTFVTADGWPVVALARRGGADVALTTGSDLVIPLCRLAARSRTPVYLFGSERSILDAAGARLRTLCPGLLVVGSDAPPPVFAPVSDMAREAVGRIEGSGARLCFVALGAPKQEAFSTFAVDLCPAVGFVCIGASLDFIAGAQRRAPIALRRLRLEWAWRVARHPRRLAVRYVRCGLLLARLALRPTV